MIVYDPRDVEVMTLVGQIDPLGVVVLCALEKMWPEQVKMARLAFMTKVRDARKTLLPVLDAIEQCGYATRTGSQAHESWKITDIGRFTLHSLVASPAASTDRLPSRSQPALPIALPLLPTCDLSTPVDNFAENLSGARSYSSDLLIDLKSNQIDRSEEDIPEKISERRAWCDRHNVTGEKRARIIADAWCTPERLDAWLGHWTASGCTAGGEKFRSKYGPLNYAIACALHTNKDGSHDEPPALEAVEQNDPDPIESIESEKISEPPSAIAMLRDQIREAESALGQSDWSEHAALKARRADLYRSLQDALEAETISADIEEQP